MTSSAYANTPSKNMIVLAANASRTNANNAMGSPVLGLAHVV